MEPLRDTKYKLSFSIGSCSGTPPLHLVYSYSVSAWVPAVEPHLRGLAGSQQVPAAQNLGSGRQAANKI